MLYKSVGHMVARVYVDMLNVNVFIVTYFLSLLLLFSACLLLLTLEQEFSC